MPVPFLDVGLKNMSEHWTKKKRSWCDALCVLHVLPVLYSIKRGQVERHPGAFLGDVYAPYGIGLFRIRCFFFSFASRNCLDFLEQWVRKIPRLEAGRTAKKTYLGLECV